MTELPKLGTRVRYVPNEGASWRTPVTGVVVKHWPAYRWFDDEDGVWRDVEAKVSIKVDEIPKWWGYPGTDRFCPDLDEVELV